MCSQPGTSAVLKSEACISCDVHATKAVRPYCTSSSPDGQNSKRKTTSLLDDGSSDTPKVDLVGPDLVGKDNGGLVESRISVDVSEKLVSAPDVVDIQLESIKSADIKAIRLHSIRATDIKETKLPSLLKKEDSSATHLKSGFVEESKHDCHPREVVDQKASRSCASQVKRKSLSPGVYYDDVNKRPAIICDFFAKGWCIKGSSCRFLHKREHVDSARQAEEGGTLSTKSGPRVEEGSGDKADSSKLPLHHQLDVVVGNDDLLPSSTGKHSLQDGEGLRRIPFNEPDKCASLEREVSSSLLSAESQKSPPSKDTSKSFSGQRGIEAGIFKDNISSNHYSIVGGCSVHMHNGSSSPGCGSLPREVGLASGSNSSSRFSYSLQQSAAIRRHYLSDGHNLPGCGSPMDIDSISCVPVSSERPPYQTSGWKANSSNYTYLKEDVCGAHYSLSSDRDDSAFVQHLRDPPALTKYKTRFTPYDWEPSVPFRPSFFVPFLGASSSDIPYDPIRDSLEQPDLGPLSSRHSSQNHGSTLPDLRCIPERDSVESNKKFHSDTLDKSYYDDSKGVPVVEAESAATSASDAQNKNICAYDDPVVPTSVKDLLKASRRIADGSSILRSDGVRQKDVGAEKGRETNELGEEEAKAIKHFRAALIDFVKELMKPIWHGGRLSKDVYKVIVQKAEDKILSSLQPDQVPNTLESIKQYLSSSRPKILRLIQAYVDKYGTF